MNIELKPIAQKKLDQMAATVHGVLVKNEAGAWAAVSDAGRVMWLDGFEGRADETRATAQAEIGALRAKVDLFRRACEDLLDDRPIERAFILRKQAEAVEKFGQEIGVFDSEYDDQEYVEIPRREVKAYAQRLRQQATEAERAGGEK